MNLPELVDVARNKSYFVDVQSYIDFCRQYLEFVETGLQAEIVSQNENHYRFYQYKAEGHYNISRPINSRLMYQSAHAHILVGNYSGRGRGDGTLPAKTCCNVVKTCRPCLRRVLI